MEQAEELYIAIDGGGSKTDSVLLDRSGKVLNRVIGEATNVNDIGFEQVERRLTTLLDELLAEYGGRVLPLRQIYAGMSGGGLVKNRSSLHTLFRELLPRCAEIKNGGDGLNALVAGLGFEEGMVLIAGTGSILHVRSRQSIHQVGGWGYMLGDEGGGFDIGSKVIQASLKAMDGRSPRTLLLELTEDKLGSSLVEAIPVIYQNGKKYIAGFAPLAFQAAEQGDAAAISLLDEVAHELATMARTGSRYLQADSWKLILSGGLWQAGDGLKNRLRKHLEERFVLMPLDMPPVYGAAILAVHSLDENLGMDLASFKSTFHASLSKQSWRRFN